MTHTDDAEQVLSDCRADRDARRFDQTPVRLAALASVVVDLARTVDQLADEDPIEARAAVADAAAERRALYERPLSTEDAGRAALAAFGNRGVPLGVETPVMVPAPTYADPDAVVPGPSRDTVDPTALHAFRRTAARELTIVADVLADLYGRWIGEDMPPDVLDADEYPFTRSLDDLTAEVRAAAERIAARCDDAEERQAREDEERHSPSGRRPPWD